MRNPVDGGGGDVEAVALLEKELNLVLADPGLGSLAMLGSQLGDQFLVLRGNPAGAAMRSSGAISQAHLALLSEPLDPLDDCRARGAKGPRGVRDVSSVGKEGIDHRPAVALGLPRVSQPVVASLSSCHGITAGP